MSTDTCQLALVESANSGENPTVTHSKYQFWNDIAISWWVALGVSAAGIYDFYRGQPPSGVIDLGAGPALAAFVTACIVTAALATLADSAAPDRRNSIRRCLLFVSVIPSLIADPTYSCLLIAISLMDVRRRDDRLIRTILTSGILVAVAILLLTEDTPRITAEIEAMIGIGIAFLIITMLGDTFRQLDQGYAIRTELAKVSERMRLAEELHDSVGHHLLAASVQLQKATALRTRDSHESYRSVSLAQQAISESIADTRLIVDATRANQPQFDIEASIRGMVRRMSSDGLQVTINIQGDPSVLGHITQITLYRVIQEGFSNLVRHSDATQAEVTCIITDRLATLRVGDNGCGFDPGDIGFTGGLRNIARRIEDLGGKLRVDSTPGATTINVELPR
ncbi:MAG: sensor histidine kinase [Granulosicoccus sp.]